MLTLFNHLSIHSFIHPVMHPAFVHLLIIIHEFSRFGGLPTDSCTMGSGEGLWGSPWVYKLIPTTKNAHEIAFADLDTWLSGTHSQNCQHLVVSILVGQRLKALNAAISDFDGGLMGPVSKSGMAQFMRVALVGSES